MKVKVKKVSYDEIEIKKAYVTIIENQLKDMVTTGIQPKNNFRVFQSSDAAVKDLRSRNQRVKKLLVVELDTNKLNGDKIVAGEVLEYEGKVGLPQVKKVTEVE